MSEHLPSEKCPLKGRHLSVAHARACPYCYEEHLASNQMVCDHQPTYTQLADRRLDYNAQCPFCEIDALSTVLKAANDEAVRLRAALEAIRDGTDLHALKYPAEYAAKVLEPADETTPANPAYPSPPKDGPAPDIRRYGDTSTEQQK